MLLVSIAVVVIATELMYLLANLIINNLLKFFMYYTNLTYNLFWNFFHPFSWYCLILVKFSCLRVLLSLLLFVCFVFITSALVFLLLFLLLISSCICLFFFSFVSFIMCVKYKTLNTSMRFSVVYYYCSNESWFKKNKMPIEINHNKDMRVLYVCKAAVLFNFSLFFVCVQTSQRLCTFIT